MDPVTSVKSVSCVGMMDSTVGNYEYYGRKETGGVRNRPTPVRKVLPETGISVGIGREASNISGVVLSEGQSPYNYRIGPAGASTSSDMRAGAPLPTPPLTSRFNRPEPQQTKVSILFVRHSESCANMLKKVGRSGFKGGYEANKYLDPELTTRGHAMAVERGRELTRLIPTTLGGEGPLYLGASVLRRTQQTARRLREGMDVGPDTIFVLPYISELSNVFGRTVGFDKDNTPVPREQRLPAVVAGQPTLDFGEYDDVADGRIPNAIKFFQWLGSRIVMPGSFLFDVERGRPAHIRLVIVTHGHWMTGLAKMLGSPIKYNNLESTVVTVTYGREGELLPPGVQWKAGVPPMTHLRFTPSPAANRMACPDECAGAIICSGVRMPVCERLEGLYRQYATAPVEIIRSLERDLRIMELYQPMARPQVVVALDNLRKHVAGKRSRDQLAADLLAMMAAYGCEGGSDEEACRLVEGALARPNIERLDEATLVRIADAARTPGLRNYTRKATGWFGVRRGTRYTKSRTGMRRDLEMVRDSVCRAPAALPLRENLIPAGILATYPEHAQNLEAASVLQFPSEGSSTVATAPSRATSVAPVRRQPTWLNRILGRRRAVGGSRKTQKSKSKTKKQRSSRNRWKDHR